MSHLKISYVITCGSH